MVEKNRQNKVKVHCFSCAEQRKMILQPFALFLGILDFNGLWFCIIHVSIIELDLFKLKCENNFLSPIYKLHQNASTAHLKILSKANPSKTLTQINDKQLKHYDLNQFHFLSIQFDFRTLKKLKKITQTNPSSDHKVSL